MGRTIHGPSHYMSMALLTTCNCCVFNNFQSTKLLNLYCNYWWIILFPINTFACIHQILSFEHIIVFKKLHVMVSRTKQGILIWTNGIAIMWRSPFRILRQGQSNNTNVTYPVCDNLAHRGHQPRRCNGTTCHGKLQRRAWFDLLPSVPLKRPWETDHKPSKLIQNKYNYWALHRLSIDI